MKFPNLDSNQFAVIMADSHTGVILNVNHEVYKSDSNDSMYTVFENIDSAKDFIKDIAMINDRIEFIIYDYKQKTVDFIKAKG